MLKELSKLMEEKGYDIDDMEIALYIAKDKLSKATPNVNGYPAPDNERSQNNVAAHSAIKGFMRKWSSTISDIKSGNMPHPKVLDSYMEERGNLSVPEGASPGVMPPKISPETRAKAVMHHSKPQVIRYTPKVVRDQEASTLVYSKQKPDYSKMEQEAPTIDYGSGKPEMKSEKNVKPSSIQTGYSIHQIMNKKP